MNDLNTIHRQNAASQPYSVAEGKQALQRIVWRTLNAAGITHVDALALRSELQSLADQSYTRANTLISRAKAADKS